MHFSVTDYLLEAVQNSLEAGARSVDVRVEEDEASVTMSVTDDGSGMDKAAMVRALDAYGTDGKKHPKRKVGLGLPFLKQAIDQVGGDFSLQSEPGRGTTLAFRFDKTHVDCPPVGDMAQAFFTALCLEGAGDIRIERIVRHKGDDVDHVDELSYTLDRNELEQAIGDLQSVSSLALLKRYLRSQEGEEQWQE